MGSIVCFWNHRFSGFQPFLGGSFLGSILEPRKAKLFRSKGVCTYDCFLRLFALSARVWPLRIRPDYAPTRNLDICVDGGL